MVYLSLIFITYELLKAIMVGTYWKFACLQNRNIFMRLLDIAYLTFLIYLFFTHYWYVGIVILIVSVITALQTSEDVMKKTRFNKKIKGYLITDNILSILFLLLIILKEL